MVDVPSPTLPICELPLCHVAKLAAVFMMSTAMRIDSHTTVVEQAEITDPEIDARRGVGRGCWAA